MNTEKYEYQIGGGHIIVDEKGIIKYTDLIYKFPVGMNILDYCQNKKINFKELFIKK